MLSGVEQAAPTRIAVLGMGHVGTVTAVCFAQQGYAVVGVDTSETRVRELAAGHVPFYEPGLDALLESTLASGRLSFTTDAASGASGAQVVFVCLSPQIDDTGNATMCQVESTVRAAAAHLPKGAVLSSRSTLPVGSVSWLRGLLREERGALDRSVALVCNPDLLRRGSAIEDFLYPDRIVVGGDEPARAVVVSLYAGILAQSFPRGRRGVRPRLLLTDAASAELSSFAASAFLAVKVSFANEIAAVCEHLGADVHQVMAALGADHRLGGDCLDPGLGWGGSRLGADIATLTATARQHGERTPLLRAAVQVNDAAPDAALLRLHRALDPLRGRRIAVLGLASAPHTDDLGSSPAIEVVRGLLRAGCSVSVHDPVVKDLPDELVGVRGAPDAYDAARGVDAVVVATGWQEHIGLDLAELARVMRGHLVLDGRNCLDAVAARAAGLTLLQVGRQRSPHCGVDGHFRR